MKSKEETKRKKDWRPEIQAVEISKLKMAGYNPRVMSEEEMDHLQKSIAKFGFVDPVIANADGTVIGGHQRIEAAKALGMKSVPVVRVDLPKVKEKALNLALNRIRGDWDLPKLADVLRELQGIPDFDVSLTGFDLPEVSQLLDRVLAPDEVGDDDFDVEAELAQIEEPETKPGELIQLGPHRVLCGDATSESDVAELMDGKCANLAFTDPPYGVGYVGGRMRSEWTYKMRQDGERYWDTFKPGEYKKLLVGALSNAWKFSDDKCPLYLWFASARIDEVLSALKETRWETRALLVWVKNTLTGSLLAQYKYRHEPLFYCFKKGRSPRWFGPTNETTVWEHDKPSRNEGHPTVKPLELAARAIRNSSTRGDIVLDLFLGSGTTLIASEQLGRICYGTEIEPRYCDLIKRRYENAVRNKPEGK